MANKKDNIGDVSKKSESLRARSINSLHRTANDVVQQQNKRRIQASNQIQDAGVSAETEKSYNGILKNLGDTIAHLSSGVKKITIDTSKATTDAIGQYGKAVGEDININKTNTVAMALAQATPLFGFFAAKFMETDVFKDSANKIKQNIGSAMQAGMSKAGSAVGSVFNRGNKASSQTQDKPASVSDLSDLKASMSKDIPKLQTGGYVKEGGLAELHAAEVVTPIDKLYKQFGEIVLLQKEQQTTISQIFVREFRESREVATENSINMKKSFDELKAGIIGSADRTRVTWQTTLLEHPTFRNMMLMGEVLKTAIVSPIKWLFGIRGGYKGDVARAMSSSNMFLKQTNILALIYTKMMPKLDNIIQYTRASAEAMMGRVIPPTNAKKSYTMFQKIKSKLTSRSIPGQESSMLQDVTKRLGLDPGALKEAGITKLTDFLKAGKILRGMGFTVENLKSKYREDSDFEEFRNMPKTPAGVAKAAKDKAKAFYKDVTEGLKDLVGMKQDQEEREGPHSPSMAQNIAATTISTLEEAGENARHRYRSFKLWFKIKKNSVLQSKYMKTMQTHLRKLKGRLWDIVLFGLAFFKDMFFKGIGLLKPALTAIGVGAVAARKKIAGGAKTLWGKAKGSKAAKGVGNMFGKAKNALGLGKAANPFAATMAEAGVKTGAKKGIVGGVLRGTARVAGAAAGAVGGAVIGGGMGLWDMFQAIRAGDATGFVGNWITRGIAGFLGGSDSGFKGALHGSMKGGALGSAIGLVGGPPGVAIGGALGAIAGGIMGFIGGKKISQGIKESLSTIGDLASGLWKLIKLPFQYFREVTQIAWILVKWGYHKTVGKLVSKFKDWWARPGMIQDGLHWLTDKVLMIWDAIKRPFVYIADKVGSLLSIFNFDAIMESAKSLFYHIMFPLVTMKKVFKWIAEKFKKVPFIGKAIKSLGGFVGDVQSGELSNKFEKELNKSEGPRFGEKEFAPKNYKDRFGEKRGAISTTRLPEHLRKQLKVGTNETLEQQTHGILTRDNINKTIEIKLAKKRNDELAKQLEDIKNGNEKNGSMLMQNIQNISSSTNSSSSNTVNNNGGGGGAMGSTYFSNAQRLASEIALCNTQ